MGLGILRQVTSRCFRQVSNLFSDDHPGDATLTRVRSHSRVLRYQLHSSLGCARPPLGAACSAHRNRSERRHQFPITERVAKKLRNMARLSPFGLGERTLHDPSVRSIWEVAPKSEHEGYQGNYGNTVDRWYRRAAFVTWPRANSFALRAQASPQWAVEELLALPRASTAALASRVSSLLPRWKQTASGVNDVRFLENVIKLSIRVDDPALARGWLAPLGLHHLKSKPMRRAFAQVIDKHGLSWATELIASWTKVRHWGSPAWAPVLAALCADLHAAESEACKKLARWLLEREVETALHRCATANDESSPWLDFESARDEAQHVAHVLAAGAAMSDHSAITQTLSALLGDKQRASLSFLSQLLRACSVRSPALRAYVTGSSLHRECAERIGKILRAPQRTEDDWRITYSLRCNCADCKVLSEFLGSAKVDCDWPLNKFRRQHIHQTISSAQLPVLHTTLRRGSPQVLQLSKDRSLFSRERAYRARLQELLDSLPTSPQ